VCRRSEDGSIGNDQDGAVYRSDNGAESWTKISLPEGTNGPMSLEFDPADPYRLLLSAWGRSAEEPSSPDTGGGIFLSADDGKHGSRFLARISISMILPLILVPIHIMPVVSKVRPIVRMIKGRHGIE